MKIAVEVDEVAEMLGLSSDVVYRLCRSNTIPHVRAGRRILFHRQTIEEWLKGQAKNEETKQE